MNNLVEDLQSEYSFGNLRPDYHKPVIRKGDDSSSTSSDAIYDDKSPSPQSDGTCDLSGLLVAINHESSSNSPETAPEVADSSAASTSAKASSSSTLPAEPPTGASSAASVSNFQMMRGPRPGPTRQCLVGLPNTVFLSLHNLPLVAIRWMDGPLQRFRRSRIHPGLLLYASPYT